MKNFVLDNLEERLALYTKVQQRYPKTFSLTYKVYGRRIIDPLGEHLISIRRYNTELKLELWIPKIGGYKYFEPFGIEVLELPYPKDHTVYGKIICWGYETVYLVHSYELTTITEASQN